MKYAIAIDIGGTKIEGCIVDDKGKILASKIADTESKKGKNKVVANIVQMILDMKKIARSEKKKIKGVGISMPGFIDDKGTVAMGGGTLHFLRSVKLKQVLEKKVKMPVYIENDANCFAMAEAEWGAGKGKKVVVGLIWGTGVGAGIVIDGKVLGGAYGGAGEVGHMTVNHTIKKGYRDAYGHRGSLEVLTSGKNIERMYKSRGGKIKDATVKEIYASKEKVAKDVINDAAYHLGLGISNIIYTINPDIVVLGGGVSNLPAPVYKTVREVVDHFTLPSMRKGLKIVRHKISDSAGVLGAAALVFED